MAQGSGSSTHSVLKSKLVKLSIAMIVRYKRKSLNPSQAMEDKSMHLELCRFLDLPGEIRNHIYEFIFEDFNPPNIDISNIVKAYPSSKITQTCKQINFETKALHRDAVIRFWQTHDFYVDLRIYEPHFRKENISYSLEKDVFVSRLSKSWPRTLQTSEISFWISKLAFSTGIYPVRFEDSPVKINVQLASVSGLRWQYDFVDEIHSGFRASYRRKMREIQQETEKLFHERCTVNGRFVPKGTFESDDVKFLLGGLMDKFILA